VLINIFKNDVAWLREAVDDPDEVFKKVILFPLLEAEVQHKVVVVVVDPDSLDPDPDTDPEF
jgi:hypothetical protein